METPPFWNHCLCTRRRPFYFCVNINSCSIMALLEWPTDLNLFRAFSVVLVILVSALYFIPRLMSKRGTGRPPCNYGWLPFLGCAIEFGKEPLIYIRKMQRAVSILLYRSLPGSPALLLPLVHALEWLWRYFYLDGFGFHPLHWRVAYDFPHRARRFQQILYAIRVCRLSTSYKAVCSIRWWVIPSNLSWIHT